MSSRQSPSAILWQNGDQTVTLLDIPRSIAAAQGTRDRPCTDHLYSCEAREQPYQSQEPKTPKAKANLENNTVDEELHQEYRTILGQALEEVHHHYHGDWMSARKVKKTHQFSVESRKRKRNDADSFMGQDDSGSSFDPIANTAPGNVQTVPLQIDDRLCEDCNELDDRFLTNCSPALLQHRRMPRSEQWSKGSQQFRMPPFSSCYVGDCSDSQFLHSAIRNQAQTHDTRRHFDFMLLDPPWPNRSVKRTHKTPGSSYYTSPTLDTVYSLIMNMDLDMLMANGCLVGVWITNRPAIRDLVLGEGGLFASWGLQLEEEWIWLKTTLHGEPVSVLDSQWRKPYETLLLGRRVQPTSTATALTEPRRRTVMAVPDLHSRKPCLKELIEHLMPSTTDYRALEVFARNLVAGWWSWGNECLKFNHEAEWWSEASKTTSG